MNPEPIRRKSMGITLRTALMSWVVTIATVLLFATVIIPMQKRAFLEHLQSKAQGVVASLHDVASGAVVNEDFSSVVDHCTEVLKGDPALDYIVITKNDGFSVICERAHWRFEAKVGREWRPEKREPSSGIGVVPIFERRVFYYSKPFDYSGIQWGWIHVGLSLDSYDRSVASVYQRTGILTVACIVLSLLASMLYAKQLVKPILDLRQVVRQVASGDWTARAKIESGDELGSLARSVNSMAESLRRRDLILESTRFAAQKFLSTSRWETVVTEVMAKMGEAALISRIYILEKEMADDGKFRLKQRCEWIAAASPAPEEAAAQNALVMMGTDFDIFVPLMERGQMLTSQNPALSAQALELHQIRHVKSFIAPPIRVENHWWGLLALGDCVQERVWTDAERDSFQAVADMLGAAIGRQFTQNALVKAKESAEAASQAKSQFLANMSHEIRTPITGVLGMLQLLQQTELNKHQARYAANAFTSAQTLLTVIGDVLDFSKIEAGKMELDEHRFVPAEVVDTVVRLFAERAEDKGIELVFRVGPDVPRQLRGDSNRLRQILINLVGNAVKFTSGGEVVLTCQREETSARTTTLGFEIRDTGCGIDPEKLKLIFDPFAQADNSMARKYGGTGLGLTISRQFCELMGGQIAVESAVGRGSTFSFALPFKNIPDDAVNVRPALLDLPGLRVLVVDDCATTREINCEWITTWRGQPDAAADATQALEKLRQAARDGRPFSVAVLDWKMPGVDGMALARLIKEDPQLQKTGLVLLSSYTQHGGFEKIAAAGFAAFVPKPAGKSDLYDAIVTAANGDLKKSAKAAESAAAAPLAAAKPTAHGRMILLAEDNAINREVATEMLSSLGYQSRWVRNGRDAVQVWRHGTIDLILMDCQMPEMDGYEATRAIRLEESLHANRHRIPVVALTAHATNGDRDRCLAAGMDDYLTKPLDPQALAAALSKWMTPPATAHGGQGGTATAAAAEPIDYPSLLRRCFGKQELASRLVRKFAEQAGDDLKAMVFAAGQNDAAGLAAAAHRLKGAAANVSAESLRQIATELETLGRAGTIASAGALLEQSQRELDRLKTSLEPKPDSQAESERQFT